MSFEERISKIKDKVAAIPDFPKEGINFRDLCPVLRDHACFADLINLMVEHIEANYSGVDLIVGLDARGFLYGPIIAQRLGIGFVPIRKAGKLPGKTVKVSYDLEYGKDTFEAQMDSVKEGQKVVIVDDLLATGGTMSAACKLINEMKAHILECMVVIELTDLKGRNKVPGPCYSLIQYRDNE